MATHANSTRTPARRPLLRGGRRPEVPVPPLLGGQDHDWLDFASAFDITSLDLAKRRGTKRKAMAAVDHMIALLDALDAEIEDREPDVDAEPSLGAPERGPCYSQVSWADGSREDGEGEPEAGYDLPEGDDERCASGDVDREPTLGAPENHDEAPDQEHWAQGGHHGSDEPEADELEPKSFRFTRDWATVQADMRTAETAVAQAREIRQRKQGTPPRSPLANLSEPIPVGPSRVLWRRPTLRLLTPGIERLGASAHA